MELLQLKYFMKVASCENMTQAAKELHIAQPAISQSIARLEKELGVKLFEKQGRGIKLSEAGQLVKNKVGSVLDIIEELPELMRDYQQSPTVHITLKVLSSSSLMPQIMSDFLKLYPQVEFSMLQQDASKPYDILITSVASIEEARRKHLDICLEEEIGVVAPVTSPWARGTIYALKDLEKEPFIGLEKGTPFRKITDDYCHRLGFVPNYIFESDNPSTVRKFLEQGSGVGFYPHTTWGELPTNTLQWIKLCPASCKRYICLSMNESKENIEIVKVFYSFCKEAIGNLFL